MSLNAEQRSQLKLIYQLLGSAFIVGDKDLREWYENASVERIFAFTQRHRAGLGGDSENQDG